MSGTSASGAALAAFCLEGELLAVEPFDRGHIHDTSISTWRTPRGVERFLHQRLNDQVFTDIPALMHNVERVTAHLAGKPGAAGGGMHTLRLVKTRDGSSYHADAQGRPWRTFVFIENTTSYDVCHDAELAYEAAYAFGAFQRELTDLPVGELAETIPMFFSSPCRLTQLASAVEQDARGRRALCAPEIAFVLARERLVHAMEEALRAGRFPRRTVHGDTKLNNVLFDRDTRRAVAVVDLDTCMPGYSLYDFGDLVRFTAARSAEDEPDASLAGTDRELFRALVSGYLESAHAFLLPAEVELMVVAARLVTLTIGMRFLADYLEGDRYFKVKRPDHNLERARIQLRMVADLERQQDDLEAIVRRAGRAARGC